MEDIIKLGRNTIRDWSEDGGSANARPGSEDDTTPDFGSGHGRVPSGPPRGEEPPTPPPPRPKAQATGPLLHENYLSEFETDSEKEVARGNLKVYSTSEVYTSQETEAAINNALTGMLKGYAPISELQSAIATLNDRFEYEGFVKSNGSVSFTSAQSQLQEPTQDVHLATKKYVDSAIVNHSHEADPHNTIDKVKVLLRDYYSKDNVYHRSDTYNRHEFNLILQHYVRQDGTTAFTRPQSGVDPTMPEHLATAKYVQDTILAHKRELDPHGLVTLIDTKLSNYYTKAESFAKGQTYSRVQLNDIIKHNIDLVVDQAIKDHVLADGSVKELKALILAKLEGYIRADGTIPHTAPQRGLPAEHDNEFVVLSQFKEFTDKLTASLSEKLKGATNQSTWLTNDPVKATVGMVKIGTKMPREMTVQQICDAIFYGSKVGVVAPPYAEYGESVCLKIFVQGITTGDTIEIFKNGVLIGTLRSTDLTGLQEDPKYYGKFKEFCNTGQFTGDTEWKVVFKYSDGKTLTETASTKLAYPTFIGALPYWWNAQEDITMDSLRTKVNEDPQNCEFFTKYGPEAKGFKKTFNFVDIQKRSIVIVIPDSYPDMVKMVTPVQELGKDAFVLWKQPMYPNGVPTGVMYKIYVFNQPLVKLNQTIKVHFTAANEIENG